ncbi:MAG: ABC transporter ATP-binding protein [Ruminococcaceae bacterium]|nr:ABC transporter ATP-binding protein [Oscillospiraceae bacterium]
MNAIETKKLTKYYGKSRGITDLDLTVKEGDFFGFIGPNGAGKSTFIRLIMGLIHKTSGEAVVFGKEVGNGRTELLSEIGYMPSEAVFYDKMRVKDVLKLSAELRSKNCDKTAKELCERLELDVTKRINELSLGNRKKVSVVAALQHEPRLCILDEPTSGLDPLMQREFFNILKERNAQGVTVFLSSHNLSEVGKYCKNAAVIKEGRMLVCDRVEKLGHNGVKEVVLKGAIGLPSSEYIKNVKNTSEGISFLYNGGARELLNMLSTVDLKDFTVSDPELEDVFMHYYSKEDK